MNFNAFFRCVPDFQPPDIQPPDSTPRAPKSARATAKCKQESQHSPRSRLRCSSPPLPSTPRQALGSESVDAMFAGMEPGAVATLIAFPEEALTVDLPILVFFNQDYRDCNSTVTMRNGELCVAEKKKSAETCQWRAGATSHQVLKALARHYEKLYNAVYLDTSKYGVGALDLLLAKEYMRAVSTGSDIPISENARQLYGRVEGHVISVSRMCERLAHTIADGSQLDPSRWLATHEYASQAL